jgi:hypothetical protein
MSYHLFQFPFTDRLKTYEYEDDEDSLSMFPTRKVTKLNQDLINKDEFCKETCHNSREHLCADWIDTRDKTDSKYHYTADGVFSYYKNFVYKFLNLIQADVSLFFYTAVPKLG